MSNDPQPRPLYWYRLAFVRRDWHRLPALCDGVEEVLISSSTELQLEQLSASALLQLRQQCGVSLDTDLNRVENLGHYTHHALA